MPFLRAKGLQRLAAGAMVGVALAKVSMPFLRAKGLQHPSDCMLCDEPMVSMPFLRAKGLQLEDLMDSLYSTRCLNALPAGEGSATACRRC